MHVRYVARSDVGLGREGNEDAGIAAPYVLAVADGMGGHAAGEVASQAAVYAIAQSAPAIVDASPLDAMMSMLSAANEQIGRMAAEKPEQEGMGTTATVVLTGGSRLPRGHIALGHIGDSRGYLLSGGELRQITNDHTFVQTLVDDAQITPSEARTHPARSVVTKVLQGQHPVEPDLAMVEVDPGDRILLCSDGLTDVVTDDVIEWTLATISETEAAADELIRLGLHGGAPDNVTVILADVVDLDDAPPDSNGAAPTYLVGAAAGETR
ncbi:PP2C family protein-serine/threonine phosphatase [Phytoactinopolyspora halotolerans]|uniref:Serine/threonine-protein phosphatase n=1 Tax=Phytoactinopolyspora halotolerans TaxID=1981512 RepID=A0A6L9S693_9ACTN|nr:protein phosphatase 2C domain-containing protein [Phytoactinopolyspora halotolerans]NEE00164.1 serine/threonine-protein phosphatase [Phytoactinopolyspora halotolerans]